MEQKKLIADRIIVKAANRIGTLTLCLDEKEIEIGAEAVDDLIKDLAKYRSVLNPQVRLEPDGDHLSKGFVNPIFAVSESDISGYMHFRVRDPGRGWLGYLLDKHQCDLLVLHLTPRKTDH